MGPPQSHVRANSQVTPSRSSPSLSPRTESRLSPQGTTSVYSFGTCFHSTNSAVCALCGAVSGPVVLRSDQSHRETFSSSRFLQALQRRHWPPVHRRIRWLPPNLGSFLEHRGGGERGRLR